MSRNEIFDRFTDGERKCGPLGTRLVENHTDPYAQYHNDPTCGSNLTHKQEVEAYKRGYDNGYNIAVRDLKQKVDSVFKAIMDI